MGFRCPFCNLTAVVLHFCLMASVTNFAIFPLYYCNLGLWLQLPMLQAYLWASLATFATLPILQSYRCIIAILAYGLQVPILQSYRCIIAILAYGFSCQFCNLTPLLPMAGGDAAVPAIGGDAAAPKKIMGNIEVMAWGSKEELCRPCVDCGLVTGRFCDGKDEACLAAERSNGRWCEGQQTPFCSKCEEKSMFCYFCRGHPWCTPFAHK